jgi:tetratricopeptide (TPR) repeat protein
MKKAERKTFQVLLAGLEVVLFLVLIYMGYRLTVLAGENRAFQTTRLAIFENRLSGVEKRLETLTTALEDREPAARLRSRAAIFPPAKESLAEQVRAGVSANRAELETIREIMASTGLDRLAAGGGIDPEVLSGMYSEYAERRRASDSRQTLMERNESQHRQDRYLFDEYLDELYNRARIRGGKGGDIDDREAAFVEMLDKYPDAYATAMVIAEHAFAAMWSRDEAGVENYHAMLQEQSGGVAATVVTDRGIEALPNIELYLARRYLREGRNEEAVALIESLQDNYAESLVFTGGRGRERRWATVAEAVDRILVAP